MPSGENSMTTFGVETEVLKRLGIDCKQVRSQDELCIAIYEQSKRTEIHNREDILKALDTLTSRPDQDCSAAASKKIELEEPPGCTLLDCEENNESSTLCTPAANFVYPYLNADAMDERTPLLAKKSYIDIDAISIDHPADNLYPDLSIKCCGGTEKHSQNGNIVEVLNPKWRRIPSFLRKIPSYVTKAGLGVILSLFIVLLIPFILHGIGFGTNGISAGSLVAYLESCGRKGMPRLLQIVIGVLVYFIFLYKTRNRKERYTSTASVSIQTENTGVLKSQVSW